MAVPVQITLILCATLIALTLISNHYNKKNKD